MCQHLPTIYQQFIHLSRYSRWLYEENRRETWAETVKRYFDFFEKHLLENYNYELTAELRGELENAVLNLEVMPSMRALMTAGEALRRDNICSYNCSFIIVDNIRSFDEILYILLNGSGVGFSVERQFVSKLPEVPDELYDTDTTIIVSDSKLGWAKALKELISMLYVGQIPKWDLSRVRPAGSPLKTFGGRASGPDPLDALFKFVVRVFRGAVGRKLQSLECHDIIGKISESVVVGGVRRCCFFKYEIKMENGKWLQISKLKPGDKIQFEEKNVTVLDVIDNGIRETMEINMEDGKKHICTEEHIWFVYNHDLNKCEWVSTQNLNSGNYSMLELIEDE